MEMMVISGQAIADVDPIIIVINRRSEIKSPACAGDTIITEIK
jgi:hypothetical protein